MVWKQLWMLLKLFDHFFSSSSIFCSSYFKVVSYLNDEVSRHSQRIDFFFSNILKVRCILYLEMQLLIELNWVTRKCPLIFSVFFITYFIVVCSMLCASNYVSLDFLFSSFHALLVSLKMSVNSKNVSDFRNI